MTESTHISRLLVQRLHGQFDIELELNPTLNILYGKNGRGKTTILHLLANASEHDFRIFSGLEFESITIENNRGDILSISRGDGTKNHTVSLNGHLTSFSMEAPRLSEAERTALRDAFGGRATYLPAFRSILERSRRPGFTRSVEYDVEVEDDVVNAEVEVIQEVAGKESRLRAYEVREQAAVVAKKTMLCRQWFGRFVPTIRYPSILDVSDGLTEEWRGAQSEINRREQRMFEETFLRIFKFLAGIEKVELSSDGKYILDNINQLLTEKESQVSDYGPSDVYQRLSDVIKDISLTSEDNNSLLEIYRQALEVRNEQRKESLKNTKEFENSVNLFLDNKYLVIGRSVTPEIGLRRSAVSINSDQGYGYGISALSSGERQIVTMLYSASRTKVASGLFLIDEPELSLHVDWQRIILQEIQKQAPNRQIIACTHSPEVGADHMEYTQDFEPTSRATSSENTFDEEE